MTAPHTPSTPLAAATHPDPYPYYADLVAHRPFAWDPQLGMWVAAGAAAVAAVLDSPICRVRPPAEPVPPALRGTTAGTLFQAMARMTDGPHHAGLKPALTAAFATLAPARVQALSQAQARALADRAAWQHDPGALSAFIMRLPVTICAQLVGLSPAHLPAAAMATSAFAACLAPHASSQQLQQGLLAAERLQALLEAVPPAPDTLASALRAALPPALATALAANLIGLLAQSFEATAGLLGNALVTLARQPQLRAWLRRHPDGIPQVLHEVLRYDPPIQNTRRVVAVDGWIAGQQLRAGQPILVVLAAANRDPQLHAEPNRCDPARPAGRIFSGGAGAHACPGLAVAVQMAAAGLAEIIGAEHAPARWATPATYRPSVNARVPLWGQLAST